MRQREIGDTIIRGVGILCSIRDWIFFLGNPPAASECFGAGGKVKKGRISRCLDLISGRAFINFFTKTLKIFVNFFSQPPMFRSIPVEAKKQVLNMGKKAKAPKAEKKPETPKEEKPEAKPEAKED